MSQLKSQSDAWHIQNWGLWGWAETILKLIGVAIAVFGIATNYTGLAFVLDGTLVATILLGLLSLLSLVIINLRFGQREIIAFVFAILNAVGLISALLLTLQNPVPVIYPALFAIAYLLGEVTKFQFMRVTNYTESGRTPQQMQQLPLSLMVVYALIAIFVWL